MRGWSGKSGIVSLALAALLLGSPAAADPEPSPERPRFQPAVALEGLVRITHHLRDDVVQGMEGMLRPSATRERVRRAALGPVAGTAVARIVTRPASGGGVARTRLEESLRRPPVTATLGTPPPRPALAGILW